MYRARQPGSKGRHMSHVLDYGRVPVTGTSSHISVTGHWPVFTAQSGTFIHENSNATLVVVTTFLSSEEPIENTSITVRDSRNLHL